SPYTLPAGRDFPLYWPAFATYLALVPQANKLNPSLFYGFTILRYQRNIPCPNLRFQFAHIPPLDLVRALFLSKSLLNPETPVLGGIPTNICIHPGHYPSAWFPSCLSYVKAFPFKRRLDANAI